MGQSVSSQVDRDETDSNNTHLLSRLRQSLHATSGPSPDPHQSNISPTPVSAATSSPTPSDPNTSSTQSFATFSRQISASSIPVVRGGSALRGATGRRDAIFYEQQAERPLVHMEELGMRNAPITHITASPMPRRSRLSRLGSMFVSRDADREREHVHHEGQTLRRRSLFRDSLEIAREGQRHRRHRLSLFGAPSPEASTAIPSSRRRELAPISGPFPLDHDSSFLAVSSRTSHPRRQGLSMEPAEIVGTSGSATPPVSRLARFRRSISLHFDVHPAARLPLIHDHEAQTPPQRPTRDSLPNSSFSSLPTLGMGDSTFNYPSPLSDLERTARRESQHSAPQIASETMEETLHTGSPGWSDRWVDRPPVGRRESRRVSSMLGGRSTRLLRRDHEGPLPRILSLAAFAIAAQLSGSTEQNAGDLQAIGPDDLDGSLHHLVRTLQNTMHRDTIRRTPGEPTPADNEHGPSRPAGPVIPLSYLRVFRFVSHTTSPLADQAESSTRERLNGSARASHQSPTIEGPPEDSEGRTVTLVVVGVRSVPSEDAVREVPPTADPGLDALLESPPLSPGSSFLSGGAGGLLRHANGRSRFAHSRRASSAGINTFPANYDSQRHQGTLSTSRPPSADATPVSGSATPSGGPALPLSDSPPGPHPPPSTPAEPALSAYSSQVTTPSRRPSSASTIQHPQIPTRDAAMAHLREASVPITEDQDQPARRIQQRRRSDSEFARHRDLGAGAARRNGVVAPDDADTAGSTTLASRSWLIYVVGTNLAEDHPALTAPSLFTDNPSYEDMLLLSSLLGPAKPPVASSEDVASAGGLFHVRTHAENSAERGTQDSNVIQMGPGERCLVCLEEYQTREELRKLSKCSHVFHRECIDEWLTTGRNSCPLCRGQGVADDKRDEQSNATL